METEETWGNQMWKRSGNGMPPWNSKGNHVHCNKPSILSTDTTQSIKDVGANDYIDMHTNLIQRFYTFILTCKGVFACMTCKCICTSMFCIDSRADLCRCLHLKERMWPCIWYCQHMVDGKMMSHAGLCLNPAEKSQVGLALEPSLALSQAFFALFLPFLSHFLSVLDSSQVLKDNVLFCKNWVGSHWTDMVTERLVSGCMWLHGDLFRRLQGFRRAVDGQVR